MFDWFRKWTLEATSWHCEQVHIFQPQYESLEFLFYFCPLQDWFAATWYRHRKEGKEYLGLLQRVIEIPILSNCTELLN